MFFFLFLISILECFSFLLLPPGANCSRSRRKFSRSSSLEPDERAIDDCGRRDRVNFEKWFNADGDEDDDVDDDDDDDEDDDVDDWDDCDDVVDEVVDDVGAENAVDDEIDDDNEDGDEDDDDDDDDDEDDEDDDDDEATANKGANDADCGPYELVEVALDMAEPSNETGAAAGRDANEMKSLPKSDLMSLLKSSKSALKSIGSSVLIAEIDRNDDDAKATEAIRALLSVDRRGDDGDDDDDDDDKNEDDDENDDDDDGDDDEDREAANATGGAKNN